MKPKFLWQLAARQLIYETFASHHNSLRDPLTSSKYATDQFCHNSDYQELARVSPLGVSMIVRGCATHLLLQGESIRLNWLDCVLNRIDSICVLLQIHYTNKSPSAKHMVASTCFVADSLHQGSVRENVGLKQTKPVS